MNGTSRVTLRWPSLIAGALLLLVLGAGLAYVAMRPAPVIPANAALSAVPVSSSSPTSAADTTHGTARADVSVTLTPDAIQRAGIVVASATSGGGAGQL